MDIVLNPRWKGCKIVLRLKGASDVVTGIVLLTGKNSITLRDVVIGDVPLPYIKYSTKDILSATVVSPNDAVTPAQREVSATPQTLEKFRAQDLPRQIEVRERAKKAKELPSHLRGVCNDIDVDVLTNRKPMPVAPAVNGNAVNGEVFDVDYIFIDDTDEQFLRAITIIQSESVIAISILGEDVLSRHGTPSLLTVSASGYVFIFDLLSLGIAAFDRGEENTLRNILESTTVKKVVHNCQGLSDILAHMYNVQLTNVDDTLAFAANEYYSREGAFCKYVFGLPHLLSHMLALPSSQIFFPRLREGMNDELIWKERPLPVHLLLGAAKTVVHLVRLRDELISKTLERAREGSRILLDNLRSQESDTASMMAIDVPNLFPLEFLKLDTIRCKPRSERKFSDRIDGGSADPYVHFGRDMQKLSSRSMHILNRQTRSAVTLKELDSGSSYRYNNM